MNIGWPPLLTLTPSSLLYTSSVSSDPFSLPFNSHLPISCPSSLSFFSPLPSPLTPHSCSSPGDLTCLSPQVHLLSLLSPNLCLPTAPSLLPIAYPSLPSFYFPLTPIFFAFSLLSLATSLHSLLSSPSHYHFSLLPRTLDLWRSSLFTLSSIFSFLPSLFPTVTH